VSWHSRDLWPFLAIQEDLKFCYKLTLILVFHIRMCFNFGVKHLEHFIKIFKRYDLWNQIGWDLLYGWKRFVFRRNEPFSHKQFRWFIEGNRIWMLLFLVWNWKQGTRFVFFTMDIEERPFFDFPEWTILKWCRYTYDKQVLNGVVFWKPYNIWVFIIRCRESGMAGERFYCAAFWLASQTSPRTPGLTNPYTLLNLYGT
jgi:hypothetical protein